MDIKWLLFSFKGRINRFPYWIVSIISSIIYFGSMAIFPATPEEGMSSATLIILLIILWPNLAVQAKRWHDIDKSSWWILVNLIPVVGSFWALGFNGFMKGTDGENRFGSNPLG